MKDQVAAFTRLNIESDVARRVEEANALGADMYASVKAGKRDAASHWSTTLASYLVAKPQDANKSRAALAEAIAKEMGLDRFDPTRLSKESALSVKAKGYVIDILKDAGYARTDFHTGMQISQIVAAGTGAENVLDLTTKVKVDADAISIFDVSRVIGKANDGWRKFPYVADPNATTELLWHRVLVDTGRTKLSLIDFLAIRGIGINQFKRLDEAAQASAGAKQLANRAAILAATDDVIVANRRRYTSIAKFYGDDA
jgi:hypothetical protein